MKDKLNNYFFSTQMVIQAHVKNTDAIRPSGEDLIQRKAFDLTIEMITVGEQKDAVCRHKNVQVDMQWITAADLSVKAF